MASSYGTMALLYPAKVSAANAAITTIDGGAASVTFEGKNYSTGNLTELYAIRDWYGCKAAIEQAEQAQSYGIGSRNLTRADIKALYEQERRLRALLPADHPARQSAPGITLRQGVPQ